MCRRLICLISLVFVLSAAGSASADLAAHWRFDDGSGTIAADTSGNGLDGTLVGNPQWVEGRLGGALQFDGSGARVVAPNIPFDNRSFTIMMWVNPVLYTGEQVVFSTGLTGANNTDMHLRLGGPGSGNVPAGGVRMGFYNNDLDTPGGLIEDDNWYHITFWYDFENRNRRIYIDGVQEAEAGAAPYLGTSGDSVIGAWGTGQWFRGIIDDVQVYDHALTENEILAAMQGLEGYPYASNPNPSDGAIHSDTWVTMSWRAGDFAASHDVYLSDNLDDVSNSTVDAFRGNRSDLMYIVGFAGFAFPDGLVPGTTYYWRVDEVNETEPNSPWIGDIWSFTVPPRTAYNPDPADGAGFVDPNAVFTWTPGFNAKLHNVYMGTNFDEVNNATGAMPLGNASYDPGTLESEKVYYWRVDEFDPPFTHKGDVWGFTTPGAVGNPLPANGAVDVQMNATLNWTAADNAASHELYFGADADAVRNATTASPEYIGARALGSESYDPGGLAWDSGYAWRVDEVYPAETVKGLVWTFATADFIAVDDFESYNDIDPPDPASNRIFDKWIDGFGTTTNGALVGNDLPPYAEQTIVNSGAQSMPYLYDNNLKTSEATLTLVYPKDWTAEGVTKLSLWFRGDARNSAERIFVALNGNAVVYHDNPAATQIAGWNEWVIDLTEFAGVDLTNVNTFTIGFGTKNSPAAGGAGTMYFDDIRLIR